MSIRFPLRIDIYAEVCYDDIERFISQKRGPQAHLVSLSGAEISERARYLVARFQPDEVRKLAGKLRQVETHIGGLLG